MFDKLPTIVYNDRVVTDITRVVKRHNRADITRMTVPERVRDEETIELMADRLYRNSKYWWIVAIVNNISSPDMWPLSEAQLDKFIISKYGDTRRDIKHFISDDGRPVPVRSPMAFYAEGEKVDWHEYGDGLGSEQNGYIIARGEPVTFEAYERDLNEQKRNVLALRPEYLSRFIADYNAKVRNI